MSFTDYLMIATIIISIALTVVVLIQAQDAGLGNMFGGDSSIYRTRRGFEKTIFNVTIGLAGLFMLFSLLTVILQDRF